MILCDEENGENKDALTYNNLLISKYIKFVIRSNVPILVIVSTVLSLIFLLCGMEFNK